MDARPLLVTIRWPDCISNACIITVNAPPLLQGMTMSSGLLSWPSVVATS